jgi:ribosomal protein L30/L7E
MPDQVRHDNSRVSGLLSVIADLTRNPCSVSRTAWMPDQVRHDNSRVSGLLSVIADLIRNPCNANNNNT